MEKSEIHTVGLFEEREYWNLCWNVSAESKLYFSWFQLVRQFNFKDFRRAEVLPLPSIKPKFHWMYSVKIFYA